MSCPGWIVRELDVAVGAEDESVVAVQDASEVSEFSLEGEVVVVGGKVD